MPPRLQVLANSLLGYGSPCAAAYGRTWDLSVTGGDFPAQQDPRVGQRVPHQNWVRYHHSPNIWNLVQDKPWNEEGKKANIRRRVATADAFGELSRTWCEIIQGATHFVDVTSLEVPAPGSDVARDLIRAVTAAISRATDAQQPLTLRLLFGGTPQSKTEEFRQALATAVRGVANNRHFTLLFGCDYRGVAMRAKEFVGQPKTWNHSKIVAADGWRAVTGGHNMNAEGSYTLAPVVHDLSVEVLGNAAQIAHEFSTSLWAKGETTGFLDGHIYDAMKRALVPLTNGQPLAAADQAAGLLPVLHQQPRYNPPPPPQSGFHAATAIMGVGRWGDVTVNGHTGNGVVAGTEVTASYGTHYTSDHVKRLLIRGANQSISISQQDLVSASWKGMVGYSDRYHDECCELAKRLCDQNAVRVDVVVSARFAQDAGGAPYSYGNSPKAARDMIAKFATAGVTAGNVCTVAPLAFCPAMGVERDDYVWPDAWRGGTGFIQGHAMQSYDRFVVNGFGPGNHAKAMMIDDELVLIGSDNMYPSPLAEFSFIIEGAPAVAAFKAEYWDPLWKHSKRFGFRLDSNGTIDALVPMAGNARAYQADAQAPNCTGCGLPFGFRRLRHHCRSCGQVFCDACSRQRAWVIDPAVALASQRVGSALTRVCNPCAVNGAKRLPSLAL